MAFDDNQDDNNNSGKPAGTPEEQEAARQAAQQQQQSQSGDRQSVFLVAGERAFQDREAVVKNIESAQSHIATLEAERQTDRDQLAAAQAEVVRLKKIEDGLEMRNQSGNSDQTHQMSNDEIAAQAAQVAVSTIQQNEVKAVKATNLAAAEVAAKTAYGEGYVNKINEIAVGLGMTLKGVDELSMTSPDAFNRLFLPADLKPHVPTNTSVNAPAGQGQQQDQQPVNVVKMREKDRMSHVASKMKEAGVEGYN